MIKELKHKELELAFQEQSYFSENKQLKKELEAARKQLSDMQTRANTPAHSNEKQVKEISSFEIQVLKEALLQKEKEIA